MIDAKVQGLSFLPLRLSRNRLSIIIPPFSPVDYPDRTFLKYRCAVYVQEYFRGNSFRSASALPLEASEFPPEQVGGSLVYRGALIEIQSLLDSLLSPSLPKYEQAKISVCENLTRQFYTVRQLINATGQPVTQYNDVTAWSIKAGVSPKHFADYAETLFTDTNARAGQFLTWQPDNKRVLPDQPEYAYWLNNVQPAPQSLKLRVQTQFADGTVQTFTADTLYAVAPMTVYCLPVGPKALKLTDQVQTYQVWVSNENDECLSEVRYYFIDRAFYQQRRYLLFANSLGGFDTLACTGIGSEKLTTTRLISERPPHPDGLVSYAERVASNITGDRELTVHTAYLSKNQRTWLQDLTFAEQVYVLDDDWLPVVLVNTDYQADNDAETLIGRQLVFHYANQEEQHSQLPPAPPKAERPKGWRPYRVACELNEMGLRTGRKVVTMLERYFIDDGTAVFPAQIRTNLPGEEGYFAPQHSADCQITPFLNAEISRQGTYKRSNCSIGQEGTAPTIVLAAGSYGSEISQADANAKAEAAWQRQNTQAYADLYGGCVAVAEQYQWNVPPGHWHYRANQPGSCEIFFVPYAGTANVATMGNTWSLQGQGGQYIFPIWSNDLDLPARNDGWWLLRVYGEAYQQRRVKIYQNGVLVVERTVTMSGKAST